MVAKEWAAAMAALWIALTWTGQPAPTIAAAQEGTSTPVETIGRGDARRKLLLDTLRAPVETDLGQKVQFVVETLNVQGDWAFAIVHPRTPAGGDIDFRRTRYKEALDEGMFDGDTTYALLRHEGGGWKVLAFVIGPTDVTYAGWPEEFGAPPALFGLTAQ